MTIELDRRDLLTGSTRALAGGILAAASGDMFSARGAAVQALAP